MPRVIAMAAIPEAAVVRPAAVVDRAVEVVVEAAAVV